MDETDDPTGVGKKRLKAIQQSSTAAADLQVSLPSEVMTEILSRLPVRSILRFKSVCKSWYALFSDPIFVDKHLKTSTEDKDFVNHRLIINSFFSMDVKSCPIPSILHENHSTALPLDYPSRSPDAEIWIVGAVNGLVFIIVDKVSLFLWNPATRASKKLPRSGFEMHSDHDQHIAYGFGYDESRSDYKVMVIKTHIKSATGPFLSKVKIYSLTTNSWSKVQNFLNCHLLSDSGKYVSGALHWPASFGAGLNVNRGILTFNLFEGTFSQISQPCFGETVLDSVVGVLDGCLCMLCNVGGTKVDVWVMKEYGKVESWSQMFSVSFRNDPNGFQYSAPLIISGENEVLLMIGVNLVLYNKKGNTVSRPVIQDTKWIHEVDTYIETLVSPYHKRIKQPKKRRECCRSHKTLDG